MAQLLKLTDGISNTGTELVNVDHIVDVEKDTKRGGSRILLANGSQTYVAETPEQIWNLYNGYVAGPKEPTVSTNEPNWEHHK